MKTINQQLNKNKFYVYKVIYNDELVYVGKGQGNRYLHVNSGASHNKSLNELYYRCKYESTPLPEVILEYCDNEQIALDLEHHLIYTCKPEFNTQLKYNIPEDYLFEQEYIVEDYFDDGYNYWEEE